LCGVTQPTFSAGIKQLEETLGVMLVQRTSRFLGFTAEGERVLDWARTIVADSRAMREEVRTFKKGLNGHLKIAAIPTALAMVSALTTPYRAKHPNVKFTILSRTSIEILSMLDNLEVDAGLTYIDNEPLGRLRTVPLYLEQYRLLTSEDSPLGNRDRVTWAEVGKVPLCLLTPDMQNRRIIDKLLNAAGTPLQPTLESNSMIVLFSHVRTGRWASVGSHRAVPLDPDHRTRRSAPNRPGRAAAGADGVPRGSSRRRSNTSRKINELADLLLEQIHVIWLF
jgi:DNA-binding transcriptional LysR family regulator